MKAKLVQVVDGDFIVSEFEADNLVAAMSVRGFAQSGVNRNPRQRAELQDQPRFEGLLGPIWDGDCLCYECQEANDRLSA